eukprot:2256133-Amphidinium_carterae.1
MKKGQRLRVLSVPQDVIHSGWQTKRGTKAITLLKVPLPPGGADRSMAGSRKYHPRSCFSHQRMHCLYFA